MIGVYIHIPFCRTLCPYCDFFSVDIAGAVPSAYVESVCQEILTFPRAGALANAGTLAAIFFGGGTPSLMKESGLRCILEALRKKFAVTADAEITIESNPDDVTTELIEAWKRAGINRVTLGVQSFNGATLRYLGRRHDAATAVRACKLVAGGFDNWGMDLIFGAKPVDAWPETLEQCIALQPKHVSTYGLTYEPETPFAARAHEAVDDETWLRLYHQAASRLSAYDHYEISNYALPGYQCRHNLIYWRNEEYAGFGAAAYSFIDSVRARNPADIERYTANPGAKEESICLTEREIRVETLIQHFRLKAGIEKSEYVRRFGQEIRPKFAAPIDKLIGRGLLWEDDVHIAPTERGFELNNEIGLEIVG
ncbi:MAG TPA: radical SAM family heme chaperone HemW [Candidatus Bathyarchaeia archaeon]|nr:radical SAM family heme chaperone HemW [Candidatus Bathyarchaeia archaeon]